MAGEQGEGVKTPTYSQTMRYMLGRLWRKKIQRAPWAVPKADRRVQEDDWNK